MAETGADGLQQVNQRLALSRANLRRFVIALLPALVGCVVMLALFNRIPVATGPGDGWEMIGLLAAAIVVAGLAVAVTRFALHPFASALDSATTAAGWPLASDSAEAIRLEDARMRGRLAQWVLPVGMAAISLLAIVLVLVFVRLAEANATLQDKIDSLLMGLFTAILPVFATWVGTVLAFYFSNESFRVAAQAAREAAAPRVEPEAELITNPKRMIEYAKIARLEVADDAAAKGTALSEVIAKFNESTTRCIIFQANGRVPLYVIRSKPPHLTEELRANAADRKVSHYLAIAGNEADARSRIFISQRATLETARAKAQAANAANVFVTANGADNEPVIGWVPDDRLK